MLPINHSVVEGRQRIAAEFQAATPFRHVVIDDFLDQSLCRSLVADFPAFEDRFALNEMGKVGGKAVRVDVRDISTAYRQFDAQIQRREFLDLIGELTGIPSLIYDTDYIGGGTHENIDGQSLDPHIDFNYHPVDRSHRRLNLIVYLNPEWEDSWGGVLELQSDPWSETGNQTKTVAPLFNRCVIFETTEASWHGFRRITLPAERKTLSRKSFAIYLYTRDRPLAETAPSHATVYVPDSMPDDLRAGEVLADAQVADLRGRFAHLRGQLKFLYEREKQFSGHIATLEQAIEHARASAGFPLQGFAVLRAAAQGYWPDGWCAQQLRVSFEVTRRTKGVKLDIWVPDRMRGSQSLMIDVAGQRGVLELAPGTRQSIVVCFSARSGDACSLEIVASNSWTPSSAGDSSDERALGWRLVSAVLQQ